MRATLTKRFVLAAVVAAAVALDMPRAAAEPGSIPMIELHARTMKRDGGIFQSAVARGSFAVGEAITMSVTAGATPPEEMTLCGGGVGGDGVIADMLKESSFVWKVRTLPAKFESGRATFDLEWARYRADTGAARPAAQGRLTLTLPEGQRQVIDLAHGATGSRNCNAESTLIEVGVAMKEDPRLAQTMLQYDLWLTDRLPDGEQQVRHFVSMGTQGAEVAFGFIPLRFPLRQAIANQVPYDVTSSVLGTLRGRLREDGRIDVSVDTTRRDGLGARGEGPNGYSGNSGVKKLDVAPGETVEIELPAAGGRSTLPALAGVTPPARRGPSAQLTEPVTVAEGRVIVDNVRFFEGHRTSLVVRVQQVR